MRPRDLPASFLKATRTFWTDRRQPTRSASRAKAIFDQEAEQIFLKPSHLTRLGSGEREWIEEHSTCPFCYSDLWEGPEGGMCMNLICSNKECRARFNWAPGFMLEFTMTESKELYR